MEKPIYRTKPTLIKWTPPELEVIDERARAADLPRADYIRAKALDQSLADRHARSITVDKSLMAHALAKLSEAGDALQAIRIIYAVGDVPFPRGLKATLESVIRASEEVMKALGVLP